MFIEDYYTDHYNDYSDPVDYVIRVTSFACEVGHEEEFMADLGDPADGEQVSRARQDILYGGCREIVSGQRCGKKCKVDSYDRDY